VVHASCTRRQTFGCNGEAWSAVAASASPARTSILDLAETHFCTGLGGSRLHLASDHPKNFWDLSRERESSEQFGWLNRRYGETETQLGRSAITPSIRADSSQNEMI